MNKFKPTAIHEASEYLQKRLNHFKKAGGSDTKENVYVVEDKKDSILKRFVGSMFK